MGIEIKGGRELAEKLRALPDKVAKRFMGQALRKGAEPVLAEAIGDAPYKTGKAISEMNISLSSRGGNVTARVGVGSAYYMLMYEKGSHGPGKRIQPKRPFMEPALEKNAAEATSIVAAELKEKIEAEMAKPTA